MFLLGFIFGVIVILVYFSCILGDGEHYDADMVEALLKQKQDYIEKLEKRIKEMENSYYHTKCTHP